MTENEKSVNDISVVGNNALDNAETKNGVEKVKYKPGTSPAARACQFGQGRNIPGRPKQTQEQKDALAMLRAAAPQAIKTICEIMESKKARGADRLKAAEMAMQYTYGKAPQTVNVNTGNNIASEIMRELQAIRNDYKSQIDKEIEADKNSNVQQDGAPVFPPELE